MRRLILFRHGEAERTSHTGQDFNRALTARGREDARRTALALAGCGVRIDLAMVSPATRTRQTWDEASTVLAADQVIAPADLYLAGADRLLALMEGEAAATILIVGHNPGLQDLIARLSPASPTYLGAVLNGGLPTSGAALFRLDSAETGHLQSVIAPDGTRTGDP